MEKKDAPKKNAESHRGKKVGPKNEEKQLRRPPKKQQSRQGKIVSPKKKRVSTQKKKDSLAK